MTGADLTGRRFGRLVVTGRAPRPWVSQRRWAAVCECGRQTTVRGFDLTRGRSGSCGCRRAECLQHGPKLEAVLQAIADGADTTTQIAERGGTRSATHVSALLRHAEAYGLARRLGHHETAVARLHPGTKTQTQRVRLNLWGLTPAGLARVAGLSRAS